MAKKDSGKPEKQAAAKTSPSQIISEEDTISDEALDEVSGGQITSPKDSASGLPTGKRAHKPFEATSA